MARSATAAVPPEIEALLVALETDDPALDHQDLTLRVWMTIERSLRQSDSDFYLDILGPELMAVTLTRQQIRAISRRIVRLIERAPADPRTNGLFAVLAAAPTIGSIGPVLGVLQRHGTEIPSNSIRNALITLDNSWFTNSRGRIYAEVIRELQRYDPVPLIERWTFDPDYQLNADLAVRVLWELRSTLYEHDVSGFEAVGWRHTAALESVVRRLVEAGWAQADAAVIDELVGVHAVNHNPFVREEPRGRAGLRSGMAEAFRRLRLALPDLHAARLQHVAVRGDLVSFEIELRGTPRDADIRRSPKHRWLRLDGLFFVRVNNDRQIAEHWGVLNSPPSLSALGILPRGYDVYEEWVARAAGAAMPDAPAAAEEQERNPVSPDLGALIGSAGRVAQAAGGTPQQSIAPQVPSSALPAQVEAILAALDREAPGSEQVQLSLQLAKTVQRQLSPYGGGPDSTENLDILGPELMDVTLTRQQARRIVLRVAQLIDRAPAHPRTKNLLDVMVWVPAFDAIGPLLNILQRHGAALQPGAIDRALDTLSDAVGFRSGRPGQMYTAVARELLRQDPASVLERWTFDPNYRHVASQALGVLWRTRSAMIEHSTSDEPDPEEPRSVELEPIVRRLVEIGWAQADSAVIEELVAADAVNHSPFLREEPRGPGGLRWGMAEAFHRLRVRFADVQITLRWMHTNEDLALLDVEFRASFAAAELGLSRRKRRRNLRAEGQFAMRFEGGQVVEHWGVLDAPPVLKPLGILPRGYDVYDDWQRRMEM